MIVEKAVNMANLMKVPVVALAENMAYFKCPDCGSEHSIFGESHAAETAEKFGIKAYAKIPIDSKYSAGFDKGAVELAVTDPVAPIMDAVLAL